MPESPEIVVFVLLLLPGLLALGLYQSLAPVKTHEASAKVVLAIILSICSYVALAILHSSWVWIPDPSIVLASADSNLSNVFSMDLLIVVTSACFISSLIAFLLILQTSHELMHRFCRFTRITRRFGYSSHWDAVVHTKCKHSWISVKFKEGDDEYVGALESHSDASEERSILLGPVVKIKPDGSRLDWAENEYLFIPDISNVRSFRIRVVPKDSNNDKEE